MSANAAHPAVVIVSGPSGVGKTTVCLRMVEEGEFHYARSDTTRDRRPDDGDEYRFISREEFERGIEDDRYLEWADVYGELYGKPRSELARARSEGKRCLFNIDVQGAQTLRDLDLDALSIFLVPPTLEALRHRLRRRGDPEDEIERRLAEAESEMAEREAYDHVVVNDDVGRAVRRILTLVEGAS